MAKKITPAEVLAAISAGRSVKDAAALLNVSERTIYSVMATEEYNEMRREMQTAVLNACTACTISQMQQAAQVIADIMNDAENAPQVRLNAAAAIMKNALALLDAGRANEDERKNALFPWNI